MANNKNLTRESAMRLLTRQQVTCPNCGGTALRAKYPYQHTGTEYECPVCHEVYFPCRAL